MEINYENIEKEILLPFEFTMEGHEIEVNNGIVSITLKKRKI
jgi:HSP20 family molecular chaperone IbpA